MSDVCCVKLNIKGRVKEVKTVLNLIISCNKLWDKTSIIDIKESLENDYDEYFTALEDLSFTTKNSVPIEYF